MISSICEVSGRSISCEDAGDIIDTNFSACEAATDSSSCEVVVTSVDLIDQGEAAGDIIDRSQEVISGDREHSSICTVGVTTIADADGSNSSDSFVWEATEGETVERVDFLVCKVEDLVSVNDDDDDDDDDSIFWGG